MKPKASYEDLFNALSYHVAKTGIELRKEVENQGPRTEHMIGMMYVHLKKWKEEGFVKSNRRAISAEQHQMYEKMNWDKSKLQGYVEYKKISSGTPEFKKKFSILESLLNFKEA